MVYAPYGRAGVYMLQDYCRRLGIGWSEREIHDLAATLKALPPDHPLVPLLRDSPDFAQRAAVSPTRSFIRKIAPTPLPSFSALWIAPA